MPVHTPLFPPPDTHANEQWVTVFFSVPSSVTTLYACFVLAFAWRKNAKRDACSVGYPIQYTVKEHSHYFESFSTKFNTPSKNWASTGQLGLTEEKLFQPCNIWIWSIFTHVVSGCVNLPEQKKAFIQERSSILTGWDTYMAGLMSCENGLSLVKIFQGSLKILEDLHEDPFYSADLWGSLLKILKDLQNSCEDPQGSRKDLWGSVKVFASMLKIFVGIFQIFVKSLKIFGKILTDLSHTLTNLCKILTNLFRSSQIFVGSSQISVVLSSQIFVRSSQIFARSSHIYVWKFLHG